MNKLWAWLLDKLQARCTHADVTADIREGADQEQAIQWCRVCGAHRFYTVIGPTAAQLTEWRRPQPTWTYR